MFCLLPPTRLALGNLQDHRVPDASGLFNLMRNLGGAIGLALIDTVIYTRSTTHGIAIANGLLAGDQRTDRFIGMPVNEVVAHMPGKFDAIAQSIFSPMVARAAMVQSINEAWAMIALITLIPLLIIMFAYQLPSKALPLNH